jgi:hypothetical protein
MRHVGKSLWIVGGLVLLVALVIALLSASRVQTQIVRHILADQPGIDARVGTVKVSWGALHITDLTFKQGPLSVRVPTLQADLPLWRMLTAHKRIDRIEARGWALQWDGDVVVLADATAPRRLDAAGWSAVLANLSTAEEGSDTVALWEQLTQLLNQPLPLTVGEIDLQGRAVWRQAGPGADGSAEVRISGAGPTAGIAQNLQIEIDAVGARASARGIQSLSITNQLETRLASDHRIDRLNLTTELVANLGAESGERVYGLEIGLAQVSGSPRIGLELRQGESPLISAELGSTEQTGALQGAWAVSLSAHNLSHLMLGRELPSFSVDGHGDLSASASLNDAALSGTVNFLVTDLGNHLDMLSGVGDLSGEMNFAVQQSGPDTRFTRFDLALAGAAPVLEARLLQGVEIGSDAFELRVANPDEPLCEIVLAGLPPAWIQPWIAPWVLDARPVQGKLIGLVSPDGLRMVTNEPIRMERVALAEAGRTWVDDGLVEVEMGAELTPLGWQVELGRVEVARHGSPVITVQARGGQIRVEDETLKVVGRVEADLHGVMGWPGFQEMASLQSGRLTAEFGLGFEERISVATAITMDELAGADGVMLPNVEMDGRVDLLPGGAIEVHLPGKLERAGRSSEITLNLRAQSAAGRTTFESSLSSPIIHVQDLQDFVAIIPKDESEAVADIARGAPLSAVQVQTPVARWGDTTGSMQISVGQIVIPDAPVIERVTAEVTMAPDGIYAPVVEATVGEQGKLVMNASLNFDATQSDAYIGAASVKLSDIAVEPWLRWFEPGQVPVLTGRVNLDVDWQGVAKDPRGLVDAGLLQAQVTSPGGVIRALGVDVENYIQTGQTVASLGALFGALSGNEQLQQHSLRIKSATDAAALLASITFDQFSLNLDRGPSGDIVLSDLSLISPSMRLLGQGRITYRLGFPFWVQPLEISLSLSARDELGSALQQLGLLETEADNLGYLPLVSDFTLDGSLANIGTDELRQLILRALR